jgi:sugar (pentulose or hexulose) kinase
LPRGLPVIVAGGDAPTGAYGAGVTREADALVMLSTGAQVILPSPAWLPDPAGRWYTWPSVAPRSSGVAPYLKVGTLLNAGNVTKWAETNLADGETADNPSGLVVLPHLMGTRDEPHLRGAIVGLRDDTTSSAIRRALLEGMAFSVRAKLEEMTGAGHAPARIRLGGGLAHRADVRQLFADVLGIPVQVLGQPEITAFGAGLLGLHNLTGHTHDDKVETGPSSLPAPGRSYDVYYGLYRDLERALSPLAERIAALGRDRG